MLMNRSNLCVLLMCVVLKKSECVQQTRTISDLFHSQNYLLYILSYFLFLLLKKSLDHVDWVYCCIHFCCWALQAELTPLTFARHCLSPLAVFTSGVDFLHAFDNKFVKFTMPALKAFF